MTSSSDKSHVHSVFESIAPKYDMMNDIISFRRHKAWRRFTMRKMDMKPGESALDLCCGTCDWTIDIAKASGSGRTVGLDFSHNMLEIGRSKIAKLELDGRIELVQGNAMALPFADNTFDCVTIGFGLRNVPDIKQVLSEMERVTKPGGQVVCLECSKPGWQPFKFFFNLYFQRIMPLLGKWFVKSYEQYRWLPESLASFPDLPRLAEMFREAGLRDVRAYPLTGGVAALHIGTKGTKDS
ncbi:demethylmenaquinone methyltransferase [Cohnella fermenti]|uniref:Demethylmenaquinone methyltransferase n=1 Tax=Cohnella fermenti TaxID=2565925 RepID=A0A4S4BTW2_9BACL|nr:demethylmenaquinone methyltransferase [Cohnella fermenti]THF78369.1 demethylmenaquinone methyltransferase [Cohnella fermenti]